MSAGVASRVADRPATSRPSSSRSCSTNSPGGWRPVGVQRGEQTHDLGRMQRPATARRDDPPRALVERLQRLPGRVVDLERHVVPGGEEAQQPSAHAARRSAHAAVDAQHLEAEPGGRRRQARDQRCAARRGRGGSRATRAASRGSTPGAGAAAGGAWNSRIVSSTSTSTRSASGSATCVPSSSQHRRQVAHLGEREQPLVLGVGTRGAAEHVDVLGRGEPLELEFAEAPQLQPVAHHRVQPAHDLGPRPGLPSSPGRNVNRSIAAIPRPRRGSATAITIR